MTSKRMPNRPDLTALSVSDVHALIYKLLEEVQQLRDEVAELKKHKARPVFKGSNLDKKTAAYLVVPRDATSKRAGSLKRSKTAALVIHEERISQPTEPVPTGSVLVGYRDFTVQDLRIAAHNVRLRRAVYRTPEGRLLVGERFPEAFGSHFGAQLRAYVLYQHHRCHVTQPKLVEHLREWGVDIPEGKR